MQDYDISPVRADQDDKNIDRDLKRFEAAHEVWRNNNDRWDECYEFGMTGRPGFNGGSLDGRFDRVFDDTAPQSVGTFASRMQQFVLPTRLVRLEGGSKLDAKQRLSLNKKLVQVNEDIYAVLRDSNFGTQSYECFQDLSVGTGFLKIEHGSIGSMVNFASVPLTDMVTDNGPDGSLDYFAHTRNEKLQDINIIWPNAELPEELLKKRNDNPLEKIELIEMEYRDYSSPNIIQYQYRLIWKKEKKSLLDFTRRGRGSSPLIGFRWSKAGKEVYGRGPLYTTLPNVKVLNLVRQYILEGAELALQPMFQYEDDGVINPDTIELVPRAMIPKGRGSSGIEPLITNTDTRLGQFEVSELRQAIKEALFHDYLGSTEGTPMSAREVSERAAEMASKVGAPFNRLNSELIQPIVHRVIYIMKEAGVIPDELEVDGETIVAVPLAPLARAQQAEDLTAIDRYVEMMQARLGPEMANIVIDQFGYADKMRELMDVPPEIVRAPEQRDEIQAQMQQALQAQMGGQNGG
ncbi:MAG: hypothetical protein JKY34_08755 [Kordiimonadaceae bacterium]|nr:hypothetical protein [Kordiimonadaceae bacterium]